MRPLATPAALACTALLCAQAPAQTSLLKLKGVAPSDGYGYSAAPIGDVTGDGIPDLLAGSWDDPTNGTSAGRARVLSGRDGTVFREHFGDAAGDGFGLAVAGAGDVDADGVPDYAVGAPQWLPIHPIVTGLGYVRVFSGASGAQLHEWIGTQLDSGYGMSLAAVGDVDADGHDDVLVAAWWQDAPAVNSGECWVHSGADGSLLWSLQGAYSYHFPGSSADGLGDLDGDGHDDFAIGLPGDQQGGVLHGRLKVLSGAGFTTLFEHAGALGDNLGVTVRNGGDIDADGTDDVIVSANSEVPGIPPGEVHVYSGATGNQIHCLGGRSNGDSFGYTVDGLGDLDGDGYGDFYVTWDSYADWTNIEFIGHCTVYSGKQAKVLAEIETGLVNDFFALTSGTLGDLDGDGLAEWFIGAPGFAFGWPSAPGTIYVWSMKDCPATWTNYGAGWPGTNGVPAFTAQAPPVLGEELLVDLGNSRGVATQGLLILGAAKDNLPSSAGGTFLVAAPWTLFPIAIPAAGLTLQETVPGDVLLCGLELDLQVLELDPGASHGLSFTAGMELILGG